MVIGWSLNAGYKNMMSKTKIDINIAELFTNNWSRSMKTAFFTCKKLSVSFKNTFAISVFAILIVRGLGYRKVTKHLNHESYATYCLIF